MATRGTFADVLGGKFGVVPHQSPEQVRAAVDTVLARDPSDIYAGLTDETKAAYRLTVLRIADRTGAHDFPVAREVLRLSRTAHPGMRGDAKAPVSHLGH